MDLHVSVPLYWVISRPDLLVGRLVVRERVRQPKEGGRFQFGAGADFRFDEFATPFHERAHLLRHQRMVFQVVEHRRSGLHGGLAVYEVPNVGFGDEGYDHVWLTLSVCVAAILPAQKKYSRNIVQYKHTIIYKTAGMFCDNALHVLTIGSFDLMFQIEWISLFEEQHASDGLNVSAANA
ncbi:MAG: hypothetical protein RLT05_11735 [Bauldia litoralis]